MRPVNLEALLSYIRYLADTEGVELPVSMIRSLAGELMATRRIGDCVLTSKTHLRQDDYDMLVTAAEAWQDVWSFE